MRPLTFAWLALLTTPAGLVGCNRDGESCDESCKPSAKATPEPDPDVEGALSMRCGEKLARDVHLRLAEEWGLAPHQSVAANKQRHTEQMANLLPGWGVTDPGAGLAAGTFRDRRRQRRYEDLVERGLRSEAEALRVGALLEESDILDLDARIAATEDPDLRAVYGSLRAESVGHLRTFVDALAQGGVRYAPERLSPRTFQAIVGS